MVVLRAEEDQNVIKTKARMFFKIFLFKSQKFELERSSYCYRNLLYIVRSFSREPEGRFEITKVMESGRIFYCVSTYVKILFHFKFLFIISHYL